MADLLATPLPGVRTSVVSAAGLVGGYALARATGRRWLGSLPLGAAAAVCGHQWRTVSGWSTAMGLLGGYAAAFGMSHPLARRIGAWPSVATVTLAMAAAAHLASDTDMSRRSAG